MAEDGAELGVHEETSGFRTKELAGEGPSEAWNIYDGFYDFTFAPLLEGKKVVDLVRERPPGQRRILDLFGPGEVIKKIHNYYPREVKEPSKTGQFFRPFIRKQDTKTSEVDGGIAVTLVDPYKGQSQKIEENKRINLHIIEANFYDRDTIVLVKNKMQEIGFTAFDLILCRPEGPFKGMPPDIQKKRTQYQRLFGSLLAAYAGLLSEGGILLTQVPMGLIRPGTMTDGKLELRKGYKKIFGKFCQAYGYTYTIVPEASSSFLGPRADEAILKLERKGVNTGGAVSSSEKAGT